LEKTQGQFFFFPPKRDFAFFPQFLWPQPGNFPQGGIFVRDGKKNPPPRFFQKTFVAQPGGGSGAGGGGPPNSWGPIFFLKTPRLGLGALRGEQTKTLFSGFSGGKGEIFFPAIFPKDKGRSGYFFSGGGQKLGQNRFPPPPGKKTTFFPPPKGGGPVSPKKKKGGAKFFLVFKTPRFWFRFSKSKKKTFPGPRQWPVGGPGGARAPPHKGGAKGGETPHHRARPGELFFFCVFSGFWIFCFRGGGFFFLWAFWNRALLFGPNPQVPPQGLFWGQRG